MNRYRNIDGVSEPTSWYAPTHNVKYKTLGYASKRSQFNTRVTEVPHAYNVAQSRLYQFSEYWGQQPVMMTKLSVSSTFMLSLDPVGEIEVYLGNRKALYNQPSSNKRMIDIGMEIEDDYLYVRYIPASVELGCGDGRSYFASNQNYIVDLFMPKVSHTNVVRARRAINNIETFLGMPPTIWTGGVSNDVRSSYKNIIPGSTPIIGLHIRELQNAVWRIENEIDSRTDFVVQKTEFSAVGNIYMVEYIEEVLTAINRCEEIILERLAE